MNLITELELLRDKCIYIINIILKEKSFKLITKKELKNDDDGLILYELPQIGLVDKYNHYSEWGVINILKNKNDIYFTCYGLGKIAGKETKFHISEVKTEELIFIIDYLIKNHEI